MKQNENIMTTLLIIIQATVAAMVWIGAIYIGITGKPLTIKWPKK